MSQTLLRIGIFYLYMPCRSLAHLLRDTGRRMRTVLGLRKRRSPEREDLISAQRGLPAVSWSSVCRPAGTTFDAVGKADGNVNVAELAVLNALCRTYVPKSIFEIGTFNGRTTLNLALNSDARVFTLDLPGNSSAAMPIAGGDEKYIRLPVRGGHFQGRGLPITQLIGDSARFDFSPWYGQIDLVFVDGAHDYGYVVNDTDVALRLLKPEGGVIIWHDYGVWPGVTRALMELGERRPELRLMQVKDTSLVITITRGGPAGAGMPAHRAAAHAR